MAYKEIEKHPHGVCCLSQWNKEAPPGFRSEREMRTLRELWRGRALKRESLMRVLDEEQSATYGGGANLWWQAQAMKVRWRLDLREFQRLERKLQFMVRDREPGESFGEFVVLSLGLKKIYFYFYYNFFWGNKNYFIIVNCSFILLLVVFDGIRMLIK